MPFGRYKKPKICDEKNLINVSEALQGVTLVAGEYYDVEKYIEIDQDTFVYMDPPYRPLTSSSSFTSYSKSGFNDDNQRELAKWFKKLVKEKKAQAMLSNSDPNDNFFYELYVEGENDIFIEKVNASRSINSKGNKRGKISEIVVLHK
ncbi:DNA adenine methylase [Caldisalinibacter kiritimatiensis]|uniref:site-specific DNA-methyltransferase (adenine-specific) n=1 Tax=Caldisalinibacter kiritimatiensis TaxID=1304284 RepID=R1AVT6_9FIRM|nr:DNA adenine methylase [Caldisalinibacter kiritimatiensis]